MSRKNAWWSFSLLCYCPPTRAKTKPFHFQWKYSFFLFSTKNFIPVYQNGPISKSNYNLFTLCSIFREKNPETLLKNSDSTYPSAFYKAICSLVRTLCLENSRWLQYSGITKNPISKKWESPGILQNATKSVPNYFRNRKTRFWANWGYLMNVLW